MEKTIKYLNSKIWYRLLKVIYVFFLLFALVIVVGSTIPEAMPKFEREASYIQCDDGRKIGLIENNIYLYSDYISYEYEKKLKSTCAFNPADPININPDNPADLKRLEPENRNFKLIAAYSNWDWMSLIGYSVIGILAVLLIFEGIRRLFYYIVLGSFRPKA